jgi:hypothetical protein
VNPSWKYAAFVAAVLFSGVSIAATEASAKDYVIELKNHTFTPVNLIIPAGEKVKVVVKNLDKTPAEFESHDLNREKVIGAGKEATIFIGPLKAGSYAYVDEFHEDVAKGTITAK